MTNIAALEGEVFEALRPPPEMPLCEWAERYFYLPERSSAQPGPFHAWPTQREVLDVLGDPEIERVTLMKAARVGFTKGMMAMLGSTALNRPCSVILLVPTDTDARRFAVDEVEPCFEATPVLHGLIESGRLDGRNTLTMKSYPGGSLKILAAMSPRNLRSHDAKILLCDEVDGMAITAEGDPIKLAEKRTMAHHDRRIICGSTPKEKGLSLIEGMYEQSDRRHYLVPCPSCGKFSPILWKDMHWTRGKPDEVEWGCPECGELVNEKHKFEMVLKGHWKARAPFKGHAGFHLSALTSFLPNCAWAMLAAEFEEAEFAGPSKMMPFVNTVEGLPYELAELAGTTPEMLFARREDFGPDGIPEGVLLITASVDIQADRFAMQIVGWGVGDHSWVLDNTAIPGDPTDPQSWERLSEALARQYKHPWGKELGIEAATIDSGYLTQTVYEYCRDAQASFRPVYATKGVSGQGRPIWYESQQKVKGGGKLYLIGVDDGKTTLYRRLAKEPVTVRFAGHLPLGYFKELVAEKVKIEMTETGLTKRIWILPGGARNEALDTFVGNMAARANVKVDWEQRIRMLAKKNPSNAAEAAAKIARMFKG